MGHDRFFAAVLLSALWACSSEAPPSSLHQTNLWNLAEKVEQAPYETRLGREVRTLSHRPGAQLVLSLELGAAPRLSFRPIVHPNQRDQTCLFRVALRDPEGSRHKVLYEKAHRAHGATLPRVVNIDLPTWENQTVELVLRAEFSDGTGCKAYWGSPVVIDRRPQSPLRSQLVSDSLDAKERARPNVLFLGADTLRADALGIYGRTPTLTPALDRFALHSDVWLEAFSSINNTNPSFVSLMTGLYVKNHRIFNLTTLLPAHHTTLAEVLQAAGYDTQAIISAAHLGRAGLQQGFDRFTQPDGQLFAETVVNMAIDWLQEERGGEQPFFLWLHFFDAHMPHTPPQPFDEGYRPKHPVGMAAVEQWEAFRELGVPKVKRRQNNFVRGDRKLYQGEVAYLDRQLDRLLGFMENRGLLENTLVVFVADHGETLGERGFFFKHTGLYEETTHVPLMIRWPNQIEGRRLAGLVQHFDIFPTVLGAVGLDVPDQDGIDLRRLITEGGGRNAVFANDANDRGEMIRTATHMYMLNRKPHKGLTEPQFYDLRKDPRAQEDAFGQGLPEQAQLAARLDAWLADRRGGSEPEQRKIDAEERDQLRALGYLE
jgi:arylsulfatase A-like enzyme